MSSLHIPPEEVSYPGLSSWPAFVRSFALRVPFVFDLALAAVSVLIAFVLASGLPGGRANPVFVFFTVAIAFTTWIGGRRAGVIAFFLTAASIAWFVALPHNIHPSVLKGLIVRLVANLTIGAFTVWMVSRLRDAEIRNRQLLASEQQANMKAEAERHRAVGILESITDAFCALDSQWRFTYVNQRTIQVLTLSADQLIGHNIWDLFPADIEVRANYEEVMRTRKPAAFERYFHATRSWLEVHAYPAPDGGLLIFFHDVTQRRRVDARLNRFYRSEIVGIMTWNLDGRIIDANDHFLELIGYSREDLLADRINWQRMTPPEYHDIDQRALEQLRLTGVDTPYEKEFIRKDGSRVVVLAGAARLEDPADEGIAFIVDVTQKRSAEIALRESEERFRFLVDAIPQIVWTATPDGRQDFANRRWFEFSGIDPAPRGSHDYRLICHPDDVDMTTSLWEKAVRTAQPYTCLHRIRHVDGGYRWVLSRAVPQTGPDGSVTRWVGTGTDITDLRVAEEKLRESEQRFRALAENIPQMIWVVNSDGEFRYLSPKWLEYTGTTIDQNDRGGWINAIHPDDRARTLSLWSAAVSRKAAFEAEYRVRRLDGQYRWQLSRAVPLLGSAVPLWFGSTTDIEDQKKANVALIRSEKLASVGRMAATVAHEINNPLEAIMNVVYLASVERSLSTEAKELLAFAQQELIRVAHITRQTLGFYRESGTPVHVKLAEVVDGVLDLLGPRLKTKGVRIIRDYRQAPPVFAIRGELLQVLSNLIGNAMDAMPNGSGSIRLRISPVNTLFAGPSVRLTISDSGSGISRDALPHIFEPFFTTKESFGTGLGLWVTKGILEKHHGSIAVRSTPGKGTTFSVVLPTDPAPIERSA